jgi:hypothetical protein
MDTYEDLRDISVARSGIEPRRIHNLLGRPRSKSRSPHGKEACGIPDSRHDDACMMACVVDFEWKGKAAVETERGELAAGKPDGRRSSDRGTLNL